MKPVLIVSGCSLFLLALLVALAVLFVVRMRKGRQVAPRRTPAPPRMPRPEDIQLVPAPEPVAPQVAEIEPEPFPEAVPTPPPDFGSQTIATSEFDPNATIVVKPTASATLVCTAGALEGSRFHITEIGLYIGRDWSQAQIVIDDPRISKRHAWVGMKNDEVVVIDHDSMNGTFVNSFESRVTEVVFKPDDVLILPDDLARFQLH